MMSKFAQLSLFALAGLLPMSAVAENQPKPKFVTVANHYSLTPHNSSVSLKQWTGGFTDLTHKAVTYTMVPYVMMVTAAPKRTTSALPATASTPRTTSS